MIVEGLKFMLGVGVGCALLLILAVLTSALIFQLERLAYRREWLQEPMRSMPKTQINSTVIPFGLRHSAPHTSRRQV
jgi:hypothetical protein